MSGAGFRHAPTVLARSVGEEVLVALPEGAEVLSLSGTSAEVWRALGARRRTLGDLVEELSRVHEGSRDAIEGDVAALLGDLSRRGLVEASEDG